MRILVVEDDDRVARGLLTALRHAGYEVHRVATAAAALTAPPTDVVLLDLGLPDGDGLDVLRELRHRTGTAIITVTARGEERERVLGLRLGADDYVVKPFGTAELLARIEAVLRRTRAARATRAAERERAHEITLGPIVDQVWQAHWEAPSRTLDTHIAALRGKLGDALRIETIRGVGYRVAAHTPDR